MGAVNVRGKTLYLDFRYLGIRCREQTKLKNDASGNKRATLILERIEAEIVLGIFDYKQYFPNSKMVSKFKRQELQIQATQADSPLFQDFTKLWFKENEIGWKYSYKETLRNSLDKHILPLVSFQSLLLAKLKLWSSERTSLCLSDLEALLVYPLLG